MPGLSTGLKQKMKICKATGDKVSTAELASGLEVFINPTGYKHSLKVDYNQRTWLGQPGNNPRFNSVGPEELTLPQLVFDGTGVVALVNMESVSDMIKKLRAHIYDINGEKHKPNLLCFAWGAMRFFGYVRSIDINYTLFKPSGEPLRAKVDLKVIAAASVPEIILRADMKSPDLTHLVEVRAGDTLPLLCQRIYSDVSYYLAIARVNGLVDFRDLKPGMQLRFPPLS